MHPRWRVDGTLKSLCLTFSTYCQFISLFIFVLCGNVSANAHARTRARERHVQWVESVDTR